MQHDDVADPSRRAVFGHGAGVAAVAAATGLALTRSVQAQATGASKLQEILK